MSGPSGFSRLRIGDGGTERMTRGEGGLMNDMDEDLASSSSCVNTAAVITWLRLVGESRASAF